MNLRKLVKSWLPDYLPATILHRDPWILTAFWFDFHRDRVAFQRLLRGYPETTWVFKLGYHYETAERMVDFRREWAQTRDLMPDERFIFMCDTEHEVELFRAEGVEAHWIQQNVFLDERKYAVLPRVKKEFDALYIARATPCKRHKLARDIQSLAIIGGYLPQEVAYYRQVRAALPHAYWQMAVPAVRISREINRACTGLCLSDIEGAMYVSAEYLLCGVPVVNTPNIGGRDVLFPPEFVRTVAPEPEAIAAAVRELSDRRLDPESVRAGVLALMQPHRERYAALLTEICKQAGKPKEFQFAWDTPHCFHKLGLRCGMWPWQRHKVSFQRKKV